LYRLFGVAVSGEIADIAMDYACNWHGDTRNAYRILVEESR